MARMSLPSETLSAADISWIRLCRHDMECAECGGRRKKAYEQDVKAQKHAVTMPPATWDYCDERKRLLKAHFDNAQAEKTRESE